jgi:hypothetical protein
MFSKFHALFKEELIDGRTRYSSHSHISLTVRLKQVKKQECLENIKQNVWFLVGHVVEWSDSGFGISRGVEFCLPPLLICDNEPQG